MDSAHLRLDISGPVKFISVVQTATLTVGGSRLSNLCANAALASFLASKEQFSF